MPETLTAICEDPGNAYPGTNVTTAPLTLYLPGMPAPLLCNATRTEFEFTDVGSIISLNVTVTRLVENMVPLVLNDTTDGATLSTELPVEKPLVKGTTAFPTRSVKLLTRTVRLVAEGRLADGIQVNVRPSVLRLTVPGTIALAAETMTELPPTLKRSICLLNRTATWLFNGT